MTETLQLRGTLRGHNGWVTQIATNPKYPDMILSSSRGKYRLLLSFTFFFLILLFLQFYNEILIFYLYFNLLIHLLYTFALFFYYNFVLQNDFI